VFSGLAAAMRLPQRAKQAADHAAISHLLLTAACRGSTGQRNSFITLIIQNQLLLQEQEVQKSQKKKMRVVL